MITTEEKPPIQDDLEERAVNIKAVAKSRLNACVTLSSYNYKSWKTTFYQYVRNSDTDFKFKFKKISLLEGLTIFKIWRVK